MKNLIFGIIATVVFSSNSYSNQLKISENTPITIKNSVDESEIVGNLIKECIRLWSTKSFNSFYSDELSTLAEKDKLTKEETERLNEISKDGCLEMMKDHDFATAFNEYSNLKLSSERFQELVNNYFSEHPMSSQSYNKALIPNKKACINSAVIASGCGALSPWSCLGYIGVAIHC